MAKFIGETGLIYLWSKIKSYVSGVISDLNLSGTYVAKENGKGLSTNDYTTTEKNKLGGIESGAEANVQANWAETDSSDDAFIKNKPSIPSKTSDLTNDSGFITTADIPEGAAASTSTPLMDGTAAVGTELAFARGDHRHPSDTSKADKSATVSAVTYNTTSKKITKTINGTTSDVVTAAKIVTDGGGITSHQDISGKADKSEMSVSASGDKTTITLKSGTSATVINAHQDISGKVDTTTTVNGHALSGNVTVTKSDVSLGNVTNDAQVKRTEMGVANGVATLGSDGKVPSEQLPSYVDDVIEAYARSGQTALSQNWLATGSATGMVITPESGVIYVLMNSGGDSYPINSQYRWGGTSYVKLNDGGVSEMTTAEMDTATNNWA